MSYVCCTPEASTKAELFVSILTSEFERGKPEYCTQPWKVLRYDDELEKKHLGFAYHVKAAQDLLASTQNRATQSKPLNTPLDPRQEASLPNYSPTQAKPEDQ